MTRTISLLPQHRDLVSNAIQRIDNVAGRPSAHVVRFVYPDCVRTFDGSEWKCIPHDPAVKVIS